MKPTCLCAQSRHRQSRSDTWGLFRVSRYLAVVAAMMICAGQTCISPSTDEDVQGYHPGDPIDPAGAIEVIAEAGEDQEVDEGSQCWLDGRLSSGTGTLVYSWVQIGGTKADLSQNDQPLVSFVAPLPSGETEVLQFQLIVQLIADTEDSGRVIVKSADDTVRIVVKGNDWDLDGLAGKQDNCPYVANPEQEDADADSIGDVCDNCPAVANTDQADADADLVGDVCDNCPPVANTDQTDTDGDLVGDGCDNCVNTANPDQVDTDSDGAGNVCDLCPDDPTKTEPGLDGCGNQTPNSGPVTGTDTDGDGIPDDADNCPGTPNDTQADSNGDGVGDACDQPASNSPPTVHAGQDQVVPMAQNCTLAGIVTDDGIPDPPGTPVVTWSQVSGPTGGASFNPANKASTTATFNSHGTYELKLSADENADGIPEASGQVKVYVIPTLAVAMTPTTPSAGQPIQFQVTRQGVELMAADLPTGSRLDWDFGDGGTAQGYSVSHAYQCPGTYTIRLTLVLTTVGLSLTSGHGLTDGGDKQIDLGGGVSITEQPADLPVNAGQSACFSVTATGSNLSYQWHVSTNGGISWENVSGATSAQYCFAAAAGDNGKKFRCAITDSCETLYSNVATLTVNAAAVLNTFAINNGATSTTSRTVTLNNTCSNSPTQYLASESSSFTGATWQTYATAPSFTLSTGNGTKTVYFKVKNAAGESSVKSDTITLSEPLAPVVNTFAINNGAASTTSRTVTLNNSCSNSPTQYLASESSSFTGATWQTYATAPSFTLSTGNGTKTMYFKVKNAAGESSVKSDTIELNETTEITMLSSISQYGITWTFDREYQVGQFVTGDYWVVGPANVTSIDPSPTGDRNGSMINPTPGSDQAYDGRLYNFAPSIGVSPPTTVSPLALSPGQSLVSSISHDDTATHIDLMNRTINLEHAYLLTAAVLTCVAQPPSPTAFRPPYVGTWKPLYSTGQVDLTSLPRLAPVAATPSLTTYERYFERVWLDHKYGWSGRLMHPTQNMPNYGREIGGVVGDATLLLCLDYDQFQKRTLAYRVIQAGIDMYGIARLHKAIWEHGGGHGLGRRWLIVLAGHLLNDPAMWQLNDYLNSEDSNTYFADARGDLWTGWQNSGHPYAANVLWGMYHNLDGPFAGGNGSIADHEHVPPPGWDDPPFPVNGQYPHTKFESYKRICSLAYVGQATAARILGCREKWNHPPFFAYVDRWMNEPSIVPRINVYWPDVAYAGPYEGDATSTFARNMYNTYRGQY